jgi:16S rRNA (uracil1498-N3)-methyltransferase
MEVFYVPPGNIGAARFAIDGEEYHHLARVMRKRVGDRIHAADGAGTMYEAVIEKLGCEGADCVILERMPMFNERTAPLTLVQAILKQPAKLDWIVEKATELGASRMLFVSTERTIISGIRTERLRAIALAAMKQCCRCLLPSIEEPLPLLDALDMLKDSRVFFLHESAGERMDAAVTRGASAAADVAVAIGPEGGFTAAEADGARVRGAHVVTLGPRRLRSETAAIAALSQFIE